jgi:hypothetical protein
LGQSIAFATAAKPKLRLSQVQREIITENCDNLLRGFTKSRAAEHDVSKNLRSMITSMTKIINMRAIFYDEDQVLSEEELRGLVNHLRHEWIRTQLTSKQENLPMNKKTSIYNAWAHKTFGSKAFFMAVLDLGSNMMPSDASEHAHRFSSEESRALHCLDDLVIWLARFADAVTAHQDIADAADVRRKSGTVRGKSGLTAEEQTARDRRSRATSRLRQAWMLREEMEAHRRSCVFRLQRPRSWEELATCEQHLLRDFQNGRLHRECAAARQNHGGRVQAPPFRVGLC